MADFESNPPVSLKPPDMGFSVLNPKSSNFYFFPNETSVDDPRFLSSMFSTDFAEHSVSQVDTLDSLWASTGFDEWQIRDILQSFSADNQWYNLDITDEITEISRSVLDNSISHASQTEVDTKAEDELNGGCLTYTCSFCNTKCSNFIEYFKHRKKHLREKPFKCNLSGGNCSASFNCEENLEIHQEACHFFNTEREKSSIDGKQDSDKLICTRCDMSFSRVSKWKAHLVTHLKDEVFTCELCDLSFEYLAEYESHEMDHLNGEK